MIKNLNYNKDCVKHFVRYNGWLNAYRIIKNHVDKQVQRGKRKDRCKYLTFCAAQAIDVFMLEKEKYLYRDPTTNRLTNVFFFENDEESYSVITKMMGSEKQGFFGDFKKIILQDISKLESIDDDFQEFDEPETEQERENLRLKNLKKSLLENFPFDVINLDLYGNFFPNYENKFSESCQAYKHILELQKIKNDYECNKFIMFLTVYTPITINHINAQAFSDLEKTIYENLSYDRFREAFQKKFGHIEPKTLDLHLRFVIGFTKQMIFKESYPLGWNPTLKDIFCYDRIKPSSGERYKMTTFVVEYQRKLDMEIANMYGVIPDSVLNQYLTQLEDLLNNKPTNVPDEENIPIEVREDLKLTVEFRNEFLNKIGIYNATFHS